MNYSLYDVDYMLYQYRQHTDELIKIINNSNELLEGNIFFQDQCRNLRSNRLNINFYHKRKQLYTLAKRNSHVLEIGFNSGFSALVMLVSNPTLQLTSLDICEHQYTNACYEYLKKIFNSRINLIKGDSRHTLPYLLKSNNNFGLYIVDGGHTQDVAESDIRNIVTYANAGALVLIDDTDNENIKNIIDHNTNLAQINITKDQILAKIVNKRLL